MTNHARGTPRKITDEQVEAVIVRTLESTPRNATHWSSRMMASDSGLSTSSVQRIWRAFGLQPHRSETFKLSTDPLFIDKVRDVVGLYLNPPARALVLCVDEKSQIQALDRSQPVLPMRPGQIERRTHDYKRHGTTSLFAALNTATGDVIGKCYKRHRATEFKRFLREIESRVPDDLDIHLIMDNYATHKTPAIRAWLAKRPHWHVHFTPTGSSWLNMVERFFAEITQRQIRRGVHRSEREVIPAAVWFDPFMALVCERKASRAYARPRGGVWQSQTGVNANQYQSVISNDRWYYPSHSELHRNPKRGPQTLHLGSNRR